MSDIVNGLIKSFWLRLRGSGPISSVSSTTDTESKLVLAAEQKYRELYLYSTDLLKEELERFNRADEKAAKMSTTFVFLIGATAYFDKAISAVDH
jgi:hypothetical protein